MAEVHAILGYGEDFDFYGAGEAGDDSYLSSQVCGLCVLCVRVVFAIGLAWGCIPMAQNPTKQLWHVSLIQVPTLHCNHQCRHTTLGFTPHAPQSPHNRDGPESSLGPAGIPWCEMSITPDMDEEVRGRQWGKRKLPRACAYYGTSSGKPLTAHTPNQSHTSKSQTRAKIRREKNRVAARKCRAKK